jgi:hypothetical protein
MEAMVMSCAVIEVPTSTKLVNVIKFSFQRALVFGRPDDKRL